MKNKSSRTNDNAGWIFVLPLIIGLVVFFIPTVIKGIEFAFSDVSISDGLKLTYNNLANFKYALRVDPDFLRTALNDIKDLLITLPIIIVFSLFTAVLLNSKVWGRGVFRAIFFMPVIACVGMLAAMQSGLTTQTMAEMAGENDISALSAISDFSKMLQSMSFSPELISIISSAANDIFDIVNRSGVQILIFLAGIQSISPSIYESANVEGASGWEIFWKITLPMIKPMVLVNALFTFVDSITRENTDIMIYIKGIAFSRGEFGYSAAMSWLHYSMLMILLGLIFGIVYLIKRWSGEGSDAI